MTGALCRGMAYPYALPNDLAASVPPVCGIAYSRTIRATKDFAIPANWLLLDPTCHHTASDLFELLDAFTEQIQNPKTLPRLFYLWGHAYEFDDNDDWDRIEDFLKQAGGREDVWYATNIEIVDYLDAASRLQVSVDADFAYNPNSQSVWIEVDKKTIELKGGQTTEL